ncbi:hypothetical protein RUM44_012663 [Polyplax serrata]|uniref:Geranylgeranyl transferase type-2 subunit alpha n=1 Tax=Polyplax serrata TaxID=468196 RepID=A0ABR1BFQ3_POLSC
MHGRIKTRTTEEQKEIARREKQKKAKAFSETMRLILEKRAAGVYDPDSLNLTAGLLTENPDIITLWNYRREILLEMKLELDLESYQQLLEKDLYLTEQCLRVNPKSYGSWHHRIWILDNLPEPDWSREMKLCTKYLQLDERNFHCWDYRRTIALRSQVPDLSEYEFTLEKIEANFSNYSAWHLRSKLLPKIFPDPQNRFPIDEVKHKEELELVENAAFTDPNDQSAWFYLRWLLGLTEPKIHFLGLERKDDIIAVTSKSFKMTEIGSSNFGLQLVVEINNNKAFGTWTSGCDQPQSCLWKFTPEVKISPEDSVVVILVENGTELERQNVCPEGFVTQKINFLPTFSKDLRDTMTYQLSSCNQLIELEPDSKWTLLTRILLMVCLDCAQCEAEIKSGLENLTEVDPMRKGYYKDLKSKIVVELAIEKNKRNSQRFDLRNEKLTSVYHSQNLWACEEIDLSQNELPSESLRQFYSFLRCKRLNLNGNKIKHLSNLPPMPMLESLLVESNEIDQFDFDLLKRFPKLKYVSLKGNPVADKINMAEYSGSIEINLSTT